MFPSEQKQQKKSLPADMTQKRSNWIWELWEGGGKEAVWLQLI